MYLMQIYIRMMLYMQYITEWRRASIEHLARSAHVVAHKTKHDRLLKRDVRHTIAHEHVALIAPITRIPSALSLISSCIVTTFCLFVNRVMWLVMCMLRPRSLLRYGGINRFYLV